MSRVRIKTPDFSKFLSFRPRVRIPKGVSGSPWKGAGESLQKFALWLYYNPVIQVLFIIAVLVAVNIIGNQYFLRFDLTRYDTFTFNNATKNLVQNLEEDITVHIFLSPDLPAGIKTLPRDITDFYIEMGRLNGNRVNLKFYEPQDDNADALKASEFGIEQIPYANYSGDKATVGNGYLGVAIEYKGETQAIPAIRDASVLEFQTILILRNYLVENKPTISFVTGHQEYSLQQEYPDLYGWLSTQYEIKDLDLSSATQETINSTDFIVVAAPSADYSQDELQVLDQFIMRGGRVLFLMEGYAIASATEAQSISTNVFDLIDAYGVEYAEHGLLMDKNYNPIRSQGIPLEYPYWVRIPKAQMAEDSIIMQNIEQMNLFWAIPFQVDLSEYGKNKPEVTKLFKTSDDGALFMGEQVPISLQQDFVYPNEGHRTAAVRMKDYLRSYFAESDNENLVKETDKGDIMVIGDFDFVRDFSQYGVPSSTDFFLRLVYWGTNDEDMLSWKPKTTVIPWDKTLEGEENEASKLKAKLFNYATPIAVLALIGGGVYYYQRKQKSKFVD